LSTALNLVINSQNAMPDSFSWVMINFNDEALGENEQQGGGKALSMGVKSSDWAAISPGHSSVPAISIDGKFYVESEEIVKMLAYRCPEANTQVQLDVLRLIELSSSHNERLLQALKHWGWCALHKSTSYSMVNEENYVSLGQGNKDSAWERETVGIVNAFFSYLEATLAARPSITGHYVSDHWTLADCVLINWPNSFSSIVALEVAKRYPKVWANFEKVKELAPKGSEMHLGHFAGIGDFCANANKDARDAGFSIENPTLWS